ncbi:hypothetical protein AB7M47_008246 [Bradyrhizobium elkanii]
MIRVATSLAIIACGAVFNCLNVSRALAWGDEGHEVVALVAQSFLDEDVRKRVNALLAVDTDPLTAHDIASAATWAAKYRDANVNNSRERTRQWHFVDIEITAPNFDEACFNHPPVPNGTPASDGAAADCVWSTRVSSLRRNLPIPRQMSRSRSPRSNSCFTSSATCTNRYTALTIMIAAATPSGFRRPDLAPAIFTISGTPSLWTSGMPPKSETREIRDSSLGENVCPRRPVCSVEDLS